MALLRDPCLLPGRFAQHVKASQLEHLGESASLGLHMDDFVRYPLS